MDDMLDEATYDRLRLRQWRAGGATGFSRRDLLKLTTAVGAGGAGVAVAGPGAAAAAGGPIVKPLPPELFTVMGSNAEMRWSAMAGQGYLGAGGPLLRPQSHQYADHRRDDLEIADLRRRAAARRRFFHVRGIAPPAQ